MTRKGTIRTMLSNQQVKRFRQKILRHFKKHGRDLPWRETTDSYHILVSEIMLQQTQVDRVIPKYRAFIKQFPNFSALAAAPLQPVLLAWQGLGHNRRALALKKTAEKVVSEFGGRLPVSLSELQNFPGIGPYTAGAVAVFAGNQPCILIETNIRSVYLHDFFPKQKQVSDQKLLPLIEQTLDREKPARWYHALMDYGAALKKQQENPSRRSAHHAPQSRFTGSNRQIRGTIIRLVTTHGSLTVAKLQQLAGRDARVKENIHQLAREGFILKEDRTIRIP